jgi:hypothetical protein
MPASVIVVITAKFPALTGLAPEIEDETLIRIISSLPVSFSSIKKVSIFSNNNHSLSSPHMVSSGVTLSFAVLGSSKLS